MRAYLVTASAWTVSLVQGALWLVFMAAWLAHYEHGSFYKALLGSAAGAIFYTLTVWCVSRRQRRMEDAIVAGIAPGRRPEVLLAAHTGTPPVDPSARAAAAALVRHRLVDAERHQVPGVAVAGMGALLAVRLAVTDGWLGYSVAIPLLCVGVAWLLCRPALLSRKLAALDAARSSVR